MKEIAAQSAKPSESAMYVWYLACLEAQAKAC